MPSLSKSLIILINLFLISKPHFAQSQSETLKREIILINLLEGLYLTPAQSEGLCNLIKKAEAARVHYKQALQIQQKEDRIVLEDLKEVRLKGNMPTDELKRHIAELKICQHQMEDELGEALIHLENEIAALLTENQRITVETFKPCLIPPAQGRVGQDTGQQALKMVERCRQLPQRQLGLMGPMWEEKYLNAVERHSHRLSKEEKMQLSQRFQSVVKKARNLSDADFMVQKQTLADQLTMPEKTRPAPLKNRIEKLGNLLLDPLLLSLLQ
jgi:hypothetical protein